jgi:hypothetical protein
VIAQFQAGLRNQDLKKLQPDKKSRRIFQGSRTAT